jgi:hypothetical protein
MSESDGQAMVWIVPRFFADERAGNSEFAFEPRAEKLRRNRITTTAT